VTSPSGGSPSAKGEIVRCGNLGLGHLKDLLVISGDSMGKATIFWEKNNDITNLIWYDDAVLWVCHGLS
jgi:hypothetical protein